MNSNKFTWVLVLAGLYGGHAPAATPEEEAAPIQLEAQSMEIDKKSGRSVYRGDVVITKGPVTINADIMTILKQGDEVDRIIAEGKPVRFVQLPGENRKSIKGQANLIEYDAGGDSIVLKENAELWQDQDHFSGEFIRYDIEKELVSADKGESSDGRVKVIIHPKKDNKPE